MISLSLSVDVAGSESLTSMSPWFCSPLSNRFSMISRAMLQQHRSESSSSGRV